MALFHPFSTFALVFLFALLSSIVISHQQPLLNPAEQEAVYQVLDSINSAIPWRSLFPDDLCSSAPHGVVCDYFYDPTNASSAETVHVSELSFGYVSDFTPNPPCSPNSTLSPLLFTSFRYLRKLFFYQCFTETRVSVPDIPLSFGSGLEELVFVDNPTLVGSLSGILRNFTSLRRVVLTGNGVFGNIPDGVADLVNLEELTLSRNQLSGEIHLSFEKLQKLKVLDLGYNYFDGNVPESAGNLSELLKLDLSSNGFSGQIPESFKNMKRLELLDLSYNRFSHSGVPLFLAEMPQLRQVYLSGNLLGGQIPEIWENLGGILGIGLSDMGLVGNIPASMGVHLRNLSYLGLDNNKLEGTVPEEFGKLLEFVNEINLENNSLSGRVSFSASHFSAKTGHKLKLAGNPQLCVDEGLSFAKSGSSLRDLKVCNKPHKPNPALLNSVHSSVQVVVPSVFVFTIGLLFMLMFA